MSLFIKKHQIFISSTYTDLIEERSEIIKLILNIYDIPIGMEMFSADNDEQWKTIRNTIDNSDYYLLIIGHRYGSLTNEGISFTEKEFDYAKEIGIPILAYVRDRNVPTQPYQREEDPEKNLKLNKFIDKVLDNSMREFWTNISDLSTKVAIALPKIVKTSPTLGWVRSDQVNSSLIVEELAKLSQENRELKEELERLKLLQSKKKIDFKVTLAIPSTQIPVQLKYQNIKLNKLESIDIDKVPAKFKNKTNLDKFEEYNQMIDRNTIDIENYNKSLKTYENIKNNLYQIEFNIGNIGNVKANDIHIDIYFPKEIGLVTAYEAQANTHPENPINMENPYSRVLRDEIFSKNPLLKNLSKNYTVENGIGKQAGLVLGSLISGVGKKTYNVNRSQNLLSFTIDKISQTRFQPYNEIFYLVTNEVGEFEAEARIICDELEKPLIKKLKLNIIEKKQFSSLDTGIEKL